MFNDGFPLFTDGFPLFNVDPVVEEPQDAVPMATGRGGKNAEKRIDIEPAEDEEDPTMGSVSSMWPMPGS